MGGSGGLRAFISLPRDMAMGFPCPSPATNQRSTDAPGHRLVLPINITRVVYLLLG